ncbi:MAG TPA: hypothetical protein VN604_07495, partial [Nitrospirota bacterium]|nr:hypothetical protein [Nitrospirota bacterium]
MSQIKSSLALGLVLAGFLVTIAGCGDPNPQAVINPDTGTHIAANWADPALHGATAKSVSGFDSCRECHATDFSGGISVTTCLNTAGCHGAGVNAPHSAAPWRGGARTHTTTAPDNAAACALCHLGRRTPPSYAAVPPGIQPGCFNNTLCHASPGHPAGWADPAVHGTTAKSAPTATTGFSSCQPCHGASFAGGTAVTCLNTAGCHGVNVFAPHSPAPWRGGARTHTTTDTGNAAVCALCHRNNNPGTPGCFNNTLCHAQVGHPAGWADPAVHGTTAKSAPTATTGFSSCQPCHGASFAGGTA